MKKMRILHWTFTGLFATFMFIFALPDVFSSEIAKAGFTRMGMPFYLLPFLGVAKTLGVVALLVPGYRKIKEWAYAGLFIDLIGASFCIFSTGGTVSELTFMCLPILLGVLSYTFYVRYTTAAGFRNAFYF